MPTITSTEDSITIDATDTAKDLTMTTATATEITLNRGTVKQFCTAARKALRMPGKSFCAARCTISQNADGLFLVAKSSRDDISLQVSTEGGPELLLNLQGDELASLAGTRKETATITISASGYGATITWKAGSANCEMFARAEPESVELDDTATWHVPGLLNAIHRAETCCDLESTRYALSGWLVTADEGKAHDIVATDSRQLLCQHGVLPADTISRSVIVPAIGIRSIFGKRFDGLEIGQQDSGRVVLAGDGWIIRLDGLDGRFPRYESLLRDSHDTVLVPAADDPQRDSEWDTKTDADEEIRVQLNGHMQTVEGDMVYQFHRDTRYSGAEIDIAMAQRFWNRGMSLQPAEVGFGSDECPIIFRAGNITYLAAAMLAERNRRSRRR